MNVRPAFAHIKSVDNCEYASNLTHTSSLFIYNRCMIVFLKTLPSLFTKKTDCKLVMRAYHELPHLHSGAKS